jgi:hypothetical protein
MIIVFSTVKVKFLLEYVAKQKGCRAELFNDEDAKITEVNRVISSMGCDRRDDINKEIYEYIKMDHFKEIDPVEHPDKEGIYLYRVSGSKLEYRKMKNGLIELTPRAGLDAIILINRVDNNNKVIEDIYDILEYEEGHLVSVIAGGEGESSVGDIGAMARRVGITILGRDHLTKRETKKLEMKAAQNIQEAYTDSRKEEKIDLLEKIKNSYKKR